MMNIPCCTLYIQAGPSKGMRLYLSSVRPLQIGRDKKCDGTIADSTISRIHGTFSMTDDGSVYFKDSSRNGTWCVRKGSTKPTITLRSTESELHEGDSILLGHTSVLVERVDTIDVRNASPSTSTSTSNVQRVDSFDRHAFEVYSHPFTQMLRRGSGPYSEIQSKETHTS